MDVLDQVTERATLAAVMASMSDGLLILGPDRKVRYCNPRVGELVGINCKTAIGRGADDCFAAIFRSAANPAAAWTAWEQASARVPERPWFEFDVVSPSPRIVACHLFPVETPGSGNPGAGIMMRDVTAERQLVLSEERERIATDLHDGAIQSLYAVALRLGAYQRTLEMEPASVRELLRQAIGQLNGVIQEIRDCIVDLRVHELGDLGLLGGIAALAEELRLTALMQPALQLDAGAEHLLAPDTVTGILLIAREATSNIIRHARASAVTITLAHDEREVVLLIADDGRGFHPGRSGRRAGDGLRNMAERARLLGGHLDVTSAPGSGTTVRLTVPLRDGAPA
jgi:signal transduction histidine kinase